LNLRSLVLEEMIFTGNVNEIVEGTPAYWKAVESLRRLGAKVQATDVTASRLRKARTPTRTPAPKTPREQAKARRTRLAEKGSK
jgi:hypothetical protein